MLDSIAVLAEVARAQQRRALRVVHENELPRFAGIGARSTASEPTPFTPDTIERSASADPQALSVERLSDADIDIHHLLPKGLAADATRAHLAEMVSLRRGLAIQMPVSLPILAYNRLRMINKIIESRKTGLEDASL